MPCCANMSRAPISLGSCSARGPPRRWQGDRRGRVGLGSRLRDAGAQSVGRQPAASGRPPRNAHRQPAAVRRLSETRPRRGGDQFDAAISRRTSGPRCGRRADLRGARGAFHLSDRILTVPRQSHGRPRRGGDHDHQVGLPMGGQRARSASPEAAGT